MAFSKIIRSGTLRQISLCRSYCESSKGWTSPLTSPLCVVVGDKNGHVGYGLGKASEVVDAVTKAIRSCKEKIQCGN